MAKPIQKARVLSAGGSADPGTSSVSIKATSVRGKVSRSRSIQCRRSTTTEHKPTKYMASTNSSHHSSGATHAPHGMAKSLLGKPS